MVQFKEPLLGDSDMELWKGTQSFLMAQLEPCLGGLNNETLEGGIKVSLWGLK